VKHGRDGHVRSVCVKTSTSKEPVYHPIQEIYRLEAADTSDVQQRAAHRGEGSTASSKVQEVAKVTEEMKEAEAADVESDETGADEAKVKDKTSSA
jgi:hypothetical protein